VAQTKTVVLLLVGAVLFGLVVCGGGGAYWYFTHYRAASAPDVGPLAGQALSLPADTAVLGGFDLKGFLASAAYKQIAASKDLKANLEKSLSEAETKTGIRFDRDVDRAMLAVSNVGAATPDGAVIALGRFDRAKIMKAVEASAQAAGAGVTSKTLEGVAIEVVAEPGKPPGEFGVLDDTTLVAGTPGAVEALVTNRAKGLRPLEGNAALIGLVKGLDAGSGYWLVVDQSVIARGQKEAGGAAPPVPLPKNLTLAGKFDGGMDLTGEMADEAAAKGAEQMLAQGLEMVRGMAEQNAQQVPGAKAVLESIKIKADGKSLRISLPSAGGGSAALGGVLASLALPGLIRAQGLGLAGAAPSGGEVPKAASVPDIPVPGSLAPAEPPVAPPVTTPVATPRPRAPVATRATPPARTPAPSRPAPPPTTVAATPPPAAPAQPLHVGGPIAEPKKVKNVSPNYPAAARSARTQGMVILECTISPQGRVSDVRVLRGVPLLDEAAMDAVRQWEYEPTLVNGVPVPVVMTVTVNFKLH
jgi:protein TonB